jgi:hypothetical protein
MRLTGPHPRIIHDSQHAPSLAAQRLKITQPRRSRHAVVVLGAAIGWVVPLIPLSIATTWAGAVTIVGGTKIEASTSWLIAAGCLAAMVAGIVVAAVANGERWMRRNRSSLPHSKLEAYARSRGTLAWLWLPRLTSGLNRRARISATGA